LYTEIDGNPSFAKASKGKEIDILENGGLSCATFVSSVLYLHKLIKDVHSNVGSTTEDMITSGWQEIKDLRIGAVLTWESRLGNKDGKMHGHNGFYISKDEAISNDSRGSGFPRRHHYTYNDTRKIEKIYWHPDLDNF
jgi:hypothetical protein